MTAPPGTRRTDRWPSDDTMEAYVRGVIVRHGDVFQNHIVDDLTGGEFLPQMQESIPGQYDATHGIDIYALDLAGQLWILEVSRGSPRGAGSFKGGGKPVQYADGELQMSPLWRQRATHRFLDLMPDACEKVRDLLGLNSAEPDQLVKIRFLALMRDHRKAIIVPDGTHFDAIGTDIDFATEIYTRRLHF